jgi:hypothetical protein
MELAFFVREKGKKGTFARRRGGNNKYYYYVNG